MRVKRWLNELLWREARKRRLEQRYKEQMDLCTNSSSAMTEDRVQTSKNLHAHEEKWIKLAEIGEKIKDIDRATERAVEAFKKLSRSDLCLVMELRYIDRLSVEDICQIMEFSSRTSYHRRHEKALEELKKII